MSVEHCSSLSPSLKAKLQNAGMLWIDDILRPDTESNFSSPTVSRRNLQASDSSSSCFSSSSPAAAAAATDNLLQRCPQLTRDEAAEVVQALAPYYRGEDPAVTDYYIPPDIQTLHDLLKLEAGNETERVTTFCGSIDRLLGGGMLVGTVSELCGPPGVGKTQLLMQLAVNCALPKELGGLDGACLFIDTEGSFLPERFREIAHAAVTQVKRIILQKEAMGFGSGNVVSVVDEGDGDIGGALTSPRPYKVGRTESGRTSSALKADFFTVEHILQQTQYIRVLDVVSLMAVLNVIPTYLVSHPRIRMVVIDSIAFPFRSATQIGNYLEKNEAFNSGGSNRSAGSREFVWHRSRLLFRCGQLVQQHAREQKLCIVVSNQVTARTVDGKGSEPFRILVPALGDSWAYGLSTRLLLSQQHNPSTEGGVEKAAGTCHENVVFVSAHAGAVHDVERPTSVLQHRVARLVKSPTEPRGECCFSVSEKGVRDVFRVAM